MKNKEGYPDPTASKAIENSQKIPKHIKEVLGALDKIGSLLGIEVVEIRDKGTGKRWRRNG